jgi:hypothetical protein
MMVLIYPSNLDGLVDLDLTVQMPLIKESPQPIPSPTQLPPDPIGEQNNQSRKNNSHQPDAIPPIQPDAKPSAED